MKYYNYYEQLLSHLQWQAQKIIELESGLKRLDNDLSQLKKQRQVHVDKIEYKFDQLKIETLEGTLNIGISPAQGKQLEDMTVEGKEIELSDPQRNQIFENIREKVDQYMNSECLNDLQHLEGKHQVIFGQNYREDMIKDISAQVDKRIDVYLDTMAHDKDTVFNQGTIYEKVKRDIQAAIENHIINSKSREAPK